MVKLTLPAKVHDRLVKYRVTVKGSLKQYVIWNEFFAHFKVGSTKQKIARYVMRTLNMQTEKYDSRLLAGGVIRIFIVGEIGCVSVEPVGNVLTDQDRQSASIETA